MEMARRAVCGGGNRKDIRGRDMNGNGRIGTDPERRIGSGAHREAPAQPSRATASRSTCLQPRSMRSGNSRTIIGLFRKRDTLSVREISEHTGLSKTAVNKIVGSMIERGFVRVSGKGSSTESGGKKPELYALNEACGFFLSLLFTEHFCCGVLVDLRLSVRCTSNWSQQTVMSEEEVVGRMVQVVEELLARAGIAHRQLLSIAIQCPGIVDRSHERLLVPIKNASWKRDFDVRSAFANALPFPVTIHFDNTSRFNGYSELLRDEARWERTILVLSTFSFAIGGSLIRNGQLLHGTNGLIGEFGHIIVEPDSEESCHCGNRGCIEALLGPEHLARRIAAALAAFPDSRLADAEPDNQYPALFSAADAGDPAARRVLDEMVRHFSVLIHNVRMTADPDEIVLRGLFGSSCDYFRNRLRERISQNPLHLVSTDLLLTFSETDDPFASDIGAALFCQEQFFRSREAFG